MGDFLQFLFGLSLFRDLRQSFVEQFKRFQKSLREIKPFSWQTALLLSLLSWLVYLLLQDEIAKRIVSFFGWAFLILGVDWALVRRKLTVPILGLQVRYAPWVTGAILTIALYSNRLLIQDVSDAFTSYPIFSALLACIPKFIHPGPTFRPPNRAGRQDIVLVLLLGSLYSCWFQLQFEVQNLLAQYPSVLADDMSRSNFVVQMEQEPQPTYGIQILNVAEAEVRNTLNDLTTWAEVQQQLGNIQAEVPRIATIARYEIYGNPPRSREYRLWRLNAVSLPDPQQPSSLLLQLQSLWYGPSSNGRGYILQRSCVVQPAGSQILVPSGVPFGQSAQAPGSQTPVYQMNCRPLESSLPAVLPQS
ncbi:DUF5357 family protein [Leptolyngbya ohadii]|uniref:DUF5357 family protein n=1 Tax=Leptolyngbya ohadii TaxID=1962290 RepID=UPI000B59ED00|nr:DUF5357 family protein [Leptolyngbya ohadii]